MTKISSLIGKRVLNGSMQEYCGLWKIEDSRLLLVDIYRLWRQTKEIKNMIFKGENSEYSRQLVHWRLVYRKRKNY